MRRGLRFRGSREGLNRRDAALSAMRSAVLDEPARTKSQLRQMAAFDATGVGPVAEYAALVRDASYMVTDSVIKRLKLAGLTEDEILEITVAAALGATLTRLDSAIALLAPES